MVKYSSFTHFSPDSSPEQQVSHMTFIQKGWLGEKQCKTGNQDSVLYSVSTFPCTGEQDIWA